MKKAGTQETKAVRRKPVTAAKLEQGESARSGGEREDVVVLKKQIARLEAENKQLRKQVAALTDSVGRSIQSHSDSVREQRHNFFKYGNVRRY